MLDYFSNHIAIAFLLMFLSVALVLLINVILYYIFIKIAIRKFVKPELEKNDLTYVGYKWTGFWSSGDFKDNIEFALFKTGLYTTSIYSFIYYEDDGVVKRVTINIFITNLVIDSVVYSDKV